jgi:23S rRNA pseudouridine2605 synthase
MEERLQKILARAGYGSRRECEEFIRAGRVRVNGAVAELGSKADAAVDHITIDGTSLPKAEPLVYYALHKPRGVITSVSDPLNRKTVRDLIPISGTIYPVGRLDEDSEGLVLMTNDGELANKLTHPRYGHEKEYKVLVARQPEQDQLEALRHGVILEDGTRTAPAQVVVENTYGKGAWLRVILKEGRKRQIREMGSRIGLPVVRILRVRIGTLKIGSLKAGEWRALKPDEVRQLKQPESQIARPAPTHSKKVISDTPGQRSNKPGFGRTRSTTFSRERTPGSGDRPQKSNPKPRRK